MLRRTSGRRGDGRVDGVRGARDRVSIDSVVQIAVFGVTTPMLSRLSASLCLLTAAVVVTLVLLRRIGIRLRGSEERTPHKVG